MSNALNSVKVHANDIDTETPIVKSGGIPEVAPPSGVPDDGDGGHDKTTTPEPESFRLLRRLRAEVQDLRGVIELILAGTTTLSAQQSYLTKTQSDLAAIQKELATNQDADDTVHHLLNLLEQMAGNPLLAAPDQPLPAQEQTNAISILVADIRRIELLVGRLTIPSRVNQWLEKSRPGYYIPFHLVFKDEIPNEEDRNSVLNHLAWAPEVIENGIVDVSNGLVFRYSPDDGAKWRSLGWLTLGILASLAIVIGAANLNLPGTEGVDWGQRRATFAIGWLAVLIGVVVHIGVAGAKREQQTRLPTLLAISDLREMINARLGQILWKLLLVLIGFFAVAFAIDPTVSVVNAFLVGYSLDSIVEVFGTSVETKVKAVEDRLGVK